MTFHDEAREHRSLGALVVVWVVLNCAAVAIDILPAAPKRTRPRRPSRLTTTRFASHAPQHPSSAEADACRLPYRLLAPPDAVPARPIPLLVFLHGAGERGADNERQLAGLPEQMSLTQWRRRFPCFMLAPQCPDGRDWSDCMLDLENVIEQVCREFPVDRQRVFLTGLSMGGFGSWELAARRPDLFAAVVPICGGGDPQWADHLAHVSIWAVHGAEDDVVPAERSRSMIRAVRAAGGRPKHTERPGVGHDSWTDAYNDPFGVLRWMFEQRRRPYSTPHSMID